MQADNLEVVYADFIARMRDPRARPLLAMIRSFINQFQGFTPGEQPLRYAAFMEALVAKARTLSCLDYGAKAAGAGKDKDVVQTGDDTATEDLKSNNQHADTDTDTRLEMCFEYLLTNQLADAAMAGIMQSAGMAEREDQLTVKMLQFGWVEPGMIGYEDECTDKDQDNNSANTHESISLAVQELDLLAKYRTPRDKKTILLNAVRLVLGGLRADTNADDLLPCLICAVMRARPSRLLTSLKYIQLYGRVYPDEQYLFTTCLAAISFIDQLDRRAIKCSDGEFEERMAGAVEMMASYNLEKDIFSKQPGNHHHPTNDTIKQFELKAKQVIQEVQSSTLVTKFKQFMSDAERALGSNDDKDDDTKKQMDEHQRKEYEEYQLQLAMALSLSENKLDASVETNE